MFIKKYFYKPSIKPIFKFNMKKDSIKQKKLMPASINISFKSSNTKLSNFNMPFTN